MTKRTVKDRQRPFVILDAELISSLTNSEFKVYAQIKRRAGDGGECWESLEHMAKETGNSVNTLKRSLKGLKDKGLIVKTKRAGGTDLYELTTPDEWQLTGQNELPNTGQNELGGRPKLPRGVGQNELLNRSNELDPLKERREREAPKPPPLPQKTIENQFAKEESPWIQSGNINTLDSKFVSYIQERLKGRGVYEKKDPTEADAKNYIRRYMAKPRGSDERMVLHAAIADKWTEFKAIGTSPDEIYRKIREQNQRLRIPGVVVYEYNPGGPTRSVSELRPDEIADYLRFLETIPDNAYVTAA